MGKWYNGGKKYKPRLHPVKEKKIMSEINGDVVEVETKIAYKGRCPISFVQFNRPLPKNPPMSIVVRTDELIEDVYIDYTRREIVVKHKRWPKPVHIPLENVVFYEADSIRNAGK